MLLETKIIKDDGYQKQQGKSHLHLSFIRNPLWAPVGKSGMINKQHAARQVCSLCVSLMLDVETLIVWTEPHGTDMALSFQEPEGCAAIW